jgi:hypothetical protein
VLGDERVLALDAALKFAMGLDHPKFVPVFVTTTPAERTLLACAPLTRRSR